MIAEYVFVGGGSGVLVGADGVVLTNNHVIGTSGDTTVRTMRRPDAGRPTLLGTDPVGDIAVC